jgi:hypothetical protein
LAVKLPSGQRRVVLEFLPRAAIGGALVSVLAVALLAKLLWRQRRGQRTEAKAIFGASVLPVTLWCLLFLVWPEPRAVAEIRNPDREPIILELLPSNAKWIWARFGNAVELVGASIPSYPDNDGTVPIALFWRVTGPVPRSVGVFVHIEGPGKFKSADHEVVAGSYFLQNAPRDVLIRDDFGVNTADYEAGTWTVRVGLWQVSGDETRLPAYDSDGKRPPSDRISIGSFTVPGDKLKRDPIR